MADLPKYAISVRQPWAWALIHGGKDVENRSKRAITLGRMDSVRYAAIHASTGMTREEYDHARDFMESIGVQCPRPDQLIRGAVIGKVELIGTVNESDSPWFFGPWALKCARPQACEPIPSRGALGIFDWAKFPVEAVREPLPWMQSWPEGPKRKASPLRDNQERLL